MIGSTVCCCQWRFHGTWSWAPDMVLGNNCVIKCRPPSVRVAVVQSVLKSERRSFVLNSINTDEHYGGYKLLLNTDFSLNDTSREWFSCGAIVHCLESFVSRGSTSHGDRSLSVQFKIWIYKQLDTLFPVNYKFFSATISLKFATCPSVT